MTSLLVLASSVALLAAVLALNRPIVAICGFLVLTLTNTPGILVNEHELPSIGTAIVPALAAILTIRALIGLEQPRAAVALSFPVLLYFVHPVLRLPWVADTDAAYEDVIEFAKNLVIFLVLIGFLNTPERLQAAVRTSVLTLGLMAALSIFQYLTGRFENNFLGYANASVKQISGELHDWRLSGPLPDPNFFAQLLVMAFPVSIALAAGERRWALRGLATLSALMIAIVIMLTYSRGALVALLVLVLAYLLTRQRSVLLAGALTGIGLTALLAVVPAGFGDRFLTGVETGRALLGDGSVNGDAAVVQRVSTMRAGILMFLDHPLLGVGPAQFPAAYGSYALDYDLHLEAPPYPHSLYVEIAAEQGLVGLVLFASLATAALLLAALAARRFEVTQDRTMAMIVRGLSFGLIGYLATAIFLHDAFPRLFWTFLALLTAAWGASATEPERSGRAITEYDNA